MKMILNMNKLTTLKLILFVPLAGCATPIKTVDYYDMPTEALVKIRDMQQLPESALLSNRYTDLGIVSGMSCRRNKHVDAESGTTESERITFEQLELNAALMGADHITVPACVVNEKTDLTNNCWTSLVCTSHALKVTQLESPDMGR
jgi:hypothetical protein